MTTTKTPLLRRRGAEIYAALAAVALVVSWGLAGEFSEFGAWAAWTWLWLGLAVGLAGCSARAHEVRVQAERDSYGRSVR